MSKEPDPTNPKDVIGVTKCPLRLVPPILFIAASAVMKHGAAKYNPYNWRDEKIRATVYGEAIMRHLLAWMDGEENDPDSGLPHLAHIAAGCGIVLDAQQLGFLVDDRFKGGYVPKALAAQASQRKPKPLTPEQKEVCDSLKKSLKEMQRKNIDTALAGETTPFYPPGYESHSA